MGRACAACHSSKVKCIKTSDREEDPCDRCQRLSIECQPHISRQGQGPRRSRKKLKMKDEDEEDFVKAAATAGAMANVMSKAALMHRGGSNFIGAPQTSSLPRQSSVGSSSVGSSNQRSNFNTYPSALTAATYVRQHSGGGTTISQSNDNNHRMTSNATNVNNITANNSNIPTNVISNGKTNVSTGMASLQVEDEIVCNSIKMDYNHFGMHHLIRMWVALSLSRRSFNLLARASFIAAKCGISMDDVLANKSPFAIVTNTPPMTWLSLNILCPREQQSTLGPRVTLQEVPWDLLKAVHIDLNKLSEPNSPFQRWSTIRWNTKGKSRFWASPFFERDFASVDEMERVWVENKMEIIDLFLPPSEKKKFATSFFNLLYLYKEPNMTCYVQRIRTKVRPRNTQQTLDAVLINSLKIIDLETSLHYHEIRFEPQETMSFAQGGAASMMNNNNMGNPVSRNNKRDSSHLDRTSTSKEQGYNFDPMLDGDLEFTDMDMTDEFEEWMNMLDDPFTSKF
ncbi:Fungal Zn2-Cys6 binuclear cluster domain containing protein [Nitzschia inconspicua]|uniref:Fungal Zn2-Cys6 binuclear cluster domain containing protein n=1 Tax=Nitzschia inconspicua TaxID=303405 RepID=A0A9K3KH88_9STRA|nr:Fungal Zn2-Cys6 binuclear cluster domain containing protein [Nitzschia inconspicua]